jgi:hypothetical protein
MRLSYIEAAKRGRSWATRVRRKATDVADIRRCLEVAFAVRVGPDAFDNDDPATAATIVRKPFEQRDADGIASPAEQQRLLSPAADERFTRLRALIERVLGEA